MLCDVCFSTNFGSLIPNLIFIFLGQVENLQFCQFGGFLGQKSRFRNFFENLRVSETFFFVFVKRIKLSAVCKKNHRNRTNGSGDIALRSKKIIEISRLLKKNFFSFRRKIKVRPQKMKNYIGKNEIFHPKAEKLIGFFL